MGNIRVFSEYDVEKVCALWADVFGKREADAERPQIDGTEREYNCDSVFCAEEDGKLIGTVHVTVPASDPTIAGISGVCTSVEARGKGVSKLLMAKTMQSMRESGVRTAYLGTENPIAARLYSSFGFSYLPGCRIMANNLAGKGDIFDMYSGEKKNIKIVHGSPSFRIPVIGIVSLDEKQVLADINAGITGRYLFSQNSCMGLYPRYEALRAKGGDFFGATDENGTLGAVATVLPTDDGMRMDICIAESFSHFLPDMIEDCEKRFGPVYFQIADGERKKTKLLEEQGFTPQKAVIHPLRSNCAISTRIWKR